MEKIKRTISGFLALVLILGMLPGIPVSAGAEEVETQPETVAVETTQAAVPEETEAPETTAAAEIVPEETVPETSEAVTEPEETVPQETEQGETVPAETVPEETADELTASDEAADGEILEEKLVTGITVTAAKEVTYVGNQVKLSAVVTPENAEYKEVTFHVVDDDRTTAEYDEEALSNGYLIGRSVGTVAVYAEAKDTGAYSSLEQEGGVAVVEFVEYKMEINRQDIDEDNWYGGGDESFVKLMSGESMGISVHYLQNGVTKLPLETPAVEWSLNEEDAKYAYLTVNSSDCKEVTVHAKSVTEQKVITLYAYDPIGGTDELQITVYPIPYKVGVYAGADYEDYEEDDEVVSKITVNLADYKVGDEITRELFAVVWPEAAEEDELVWECSDSFVEVEHPVIDEKTEEKDTTKATLYIDNYVGTTTITVYSKNYPTIKTKFSVVRGRYLHKEELTFSNETLRVTELVAGKSAQLTALDSRDNEILDSTVVKWSLPEEDQLFATISSTGKLTAKKGVAAGKEITVICSFIGNEEEAYIELPVKIRPLSTYVEILPGDLADGGNWIEDEACNGKTIPVDTALGTVPLFKLDAQVYPTDGDDPGAVQTVKWTSSNTAIAEIDAGNNIVWKGKNGTVTITATTTDGSSKKASVKLQFGVLVQEDSMEIVDPDPDNFYLRSGKSWTFSVKFNQDSMPTTQSVTWSLEKGDEAYASISSSGKLTAKTVYENRKVTIYATAKDGTGVQASLDVLIKPKSEGILVLKDGEDYVTKTTLKLNVAESEPITLGSFILSSDPEESDEEAYASWKSSNKSVAEVQNNNDGTATITIKKVGSATITATCGKKSATVTVKGVRLTNEVVITGADEGYVLGSGKSLTLKAKSYDADGKTPTISKLTWSLRDGDEEYATISSSGKVTAKANLYNLEAPYTVTAVATATDGTGEYGECEIDIYPVVTSVQLRYEVENEETNETEVYISPYSYGMRELGTETVKLKAAVYPGNACSEVKWTSSNKKIATVDEDGKVTCLKAGTVTITATAKDGSGKKATFKLTIVQTADSITFSNTDVVAGGKSLTLKPVVWGSNEKKLSKTVEYTLSDDPEYDGDDTAYVTLKKNVLKTVKVTEPKHVIITVRTVEKNDAWEIEEQVKVTIHPATTTVTIVDRRGNSSNIWSAAESVDLSVLTDPTDAAQKFTWTSSNKKIATVDENGVVTRVYNEKTDTYKSGTITITATAKDGTGEKDTIKITFG